MSKESRRRQRQAGQVPATGPTADSSSGRHVRRADPFQRAPAAPPGRAVASDRGPWRRPRSSSATGRCCSLPRSWSSPYRRRRRVLAGHPGRPMRAPTIWVPDPTPPPAEGASPQPGYVQPDMGHTHVPVGTKITYTYCPPASGRHYQPAGRADPRSRLRTGRRGDPAAVDPQPRARRPRDPLPRHRTSTRPRCRRCSTPSGRARSAASRRVASRPDRSWPGSRTCRGRMPRWCGAACCHSRRSTSRPSSTSTRSGARRPTRSSCAPRRAPRRRTRRHHPARSPRAPSPSASGASTAPSSSASPASSESTAPSAPASASPS